MTPFYATFGTGHGYGGCFVEILAESPHAARAFMIKEHGDRWSSLYGRDDFAEIGRRHDLKRLATVQQRPGYPEDAPFFDVVKGGTR